MTTSVAQAEKTSFTLGPFFVIAQRTVRNAIPSKVCTIMVAIMEERVLEGNFLKLSCPHIDHCTFAVGGITKATLMPRNGPFPRLTF